MPGFKLLDDVIPSSSPAGRGAPPVAPPASTSTPGFKLLDDIDPQDAQPVEAPAGARAGITDQQGPSFSESAIRGTGQLISGRARALRSVGLPTKGLEDYGAGLEERHPATVTDVQGALRNPVGLGVETAGELTPQFAANTGAATVGRVVGGVLGGVAGSAIGPEGTVGGAVLGQELGAKAFQFGSSFLDEYGSILREQDKDGVHDLLGAAGAGAAAAAIDVWSPAEAVARRLALRGVGKVTKDVVKKGFVEGGKAVFKGGLKEGGGEFVQTGLERLGAHQNLTDKDAREDYAMSAIKGAIGGGALSGGEHVFSGSKPGFDPDRVTGDADTNDHTDAKPAVPEGRQPKLQAQGLFDIDAVLDNGIGPTETGGRSRQVSEKGARGKYQILPKTAEKVAKRLGLPTDNIEDRLLNDEGYNRTIARAYLGELRQKYRGDMFLAVTAYHAGPGNVDRWVAEHGYDPDNPEPFLQAIAVNNPRSARYPRLVMAHMGGNLSTVAEGGEEPGAAEDTSHVDEVMEGGELDLTPASIRAMLRENADPAAKMLVSTTQLADAIATSDQHATEAIAAERETLNEKLQKLIDEDDKLGDGSGMAEGTVANARIRINRQMAVLQAREKLLGVAEQTARRAAKQRAMQAPVQEDLFDAGAYPARGLPPSPGAAGEAGVPAAAVGPATPTVGNGINLITEPANPNEGYPVGRRAPFPVELQNPGSGTPPAINAATTVLAEQEMRAAAQAEARQTILKDVLGDKTTHSPRERFLARLKRAGMDTNLTPEEEQATRAFHLVQQSRGVNPLAVLAEEATAQPETGPLRPDLAAKDMAEQAAAEARQRQLDQAASEIPTEQQDTTLGVKERKSPAVPKVDTGVEPTPTPEQAMASNVMDRVEEHAATIREANPRQSAWFQKGAQSAMGDGTIEPPTGVRQMAWFQQGQDFVTAEKNRQERETQHGAARAARPERRAAERSERDKAIAAGKERRAKQAATPTKATPEAPRAPTREEGIAAGLKAKGEARAKKAAEKKARRAERASAAKPVAKPEKKPTSAKKLTPATQAATQAKPASKATTSDMLREAIRKREAQADIDQQDRDKFWEAVDKEVGKTITKEQAQQLSKQMDANVNMGKETVPAFKVSELYTLLETAQKARATVAPKRSVVRDTIRTQASLGRVHRVLRAELNRRGLSNVRLITSSLEALEAEHGKDTQGTYHDAKDGLSRIIEIAYNADDPLKVLSHETVHALRDMGVIRPREWEALVRLAKSDLHLMTWVNDTYGDLTEEERIEEAVAEMFSDWASVHSARAGEPFAKRIMAKIKSYISAAHSALTRAGYRDAASVMKAIESGAIGNRFTGEEMTEGRGAVRHSYAGDKSLTADLAARDKAIAAEQEMLKPKVFGPRHKQLSDHANQLIKEKFGWQRDNADGKMKYEIDDSKAELKVKFADIGETPALFGKGPSLTLGDILDHPDLFAAYPQLRDVKFTKQPGLFDFERTMQGWYTEATNTLNVTPYADDPLSVMMHEVQHAIQGIEGFARGGSSENVSLTSKSNIAKLRKFYERKADIEQAQKAAGNTVPSWPPPAEKMLEHLPALEDPNSGASKQLAEIEKRAEALWDANTAVRDAEKKYADEYTAKVNAHDTERAELKAKRANLEAEVLDAPAEKKAALRDKAYEISAVLSGMAFPKRDYAGERAALEPLRADVKAAKEAHDKAKNTLLKDFLHISTMKFDLYQLLAGEAEARDTQHRLNLSADQRRVTAKGDKEGIPTHEQIVTFVVGGSQPSASAKRSVKRTPPTAVEKRTAVESAGKAVTTTASDIAKTGHVWMAQTNDIARVYKKQLPSLEKWIELSKQSHALGHDFELRTAEIKDEYEKQPRPLKGTGKGTINDFLEDSTLKGEWGYAPGYHTNAVVSPEMKKRFDAMPKSAQDVIKAVFRFGYDQHRAMQKAMSSAVDAQFDPEIAEATDPAEIKQLEKEKAEALANVSRLYDTREGVPYAPLMRQGMFVVVGSSDAYRAAKKAGDKKLMDELRKSEDHYIVNFRDTAAGAEALEHEFKTKFGKSGGTYFERGSAEGHAAITPREMGFYFTRMEKAISNAADSDKVAAKAMGRLNRDLYLLSLSHHSARKSELHREGIASKSPVTGKGIDMMKSFVTHGRATANLIGSLSHNVEMQKTILQVKEEAGANEGRDRTDAERAFNEVMMRYAANLGVRPGRVVDRLNRAVAVYQLLMVPTYYLTNASQTVMITQPQLAAKYGYPQSGAALAKGYRDFYNATKGISPLARVDFTKFPKDVQGVLKYLNDHDHLNAGYSNELGAWEMNGLGIVGDAWNKVDRFLRLFPQRIEVMNRATAGIATYRLAKGKGMSDEAAFKEAGRIIDDTHGDYSGTNSPTPFRVAGDAGKVALQFRKFQLISGSLVVRDFAQIFTGATLAEKVQGVRALAFLGAHVATWGGLVGLPGANLFGPIIMSLLSMVTGDDKDWDDWRHEVRKELGAGQDEKHRDIWADFLYKGAAYSLMGVDTSSKVGMGNVFDLAPYSGMDQAFTSQQKFNEFIGKVAGGATGGLVGKAVNGWNYGIEQGEWNKFIEALVPVGVGNVMKAGRLKTSGLKNSKGDTLIPPGDIDWGEALDVAIGVTPRQLANQSEQAADAYAVKEHYDNATTRLKNRFFRAQEEHDTQAMQQVREDWLETQAGRKADGLPVQPLALLYKGRREHMRRQRGVIGGVATTRMTRRFTEEMQEGAEP